VYVQLAPRTEPSATPVPTRPMKRKRTKIASIIKAIMGAHIVETRKVTRRKMDPIKAKIDAVRAKKTHYIQISSRHVSVT